MKSVASREEVGRLSSVWSARFDVVIRADWHEDVLVEVPVEVPEHHVEAPVGVLFPPFERGSHRLTTQVDQLLAARRRQHRHRESHTEKSGA